MARWSRGKSALVVAAIVAAVSLSAPHAGAEKIIMGGIEQPASTTSGFSFRKVEQPILDAIEDFEKLRDQKLWEKSFTALAKLSESDITGMIPGEQGVMLPARGKISQLLGTLPPEGRRAYRLFYDAKARQLLDPISRTDGSVSEADEVAALERVVNELFITTPGDAAADRLGDAYFSRGDFAAAERAWRKIVELSPDTSLSVPRLQVKRLTALARAGVWKDFDALAAGVKASNATARVCVAGRETTVGESIDELSKLRNAGAVKPVEPGDARPVLSLPEENAEPLWVFRYHGPGSRLALDQQRGNQPIAMIAASVPPTAFDGTRVYVNMLGVLYALDAKNGKMLWRSESLNVLNEKWQFFAYQADAERYNITLAGDRMFTVGMPPARVQMGNEPYRLTCTDPTSGATLWTTQTGALATWSFAGRPLLVDQTLYATIHQREGADLQLAAIEASSGNLLWQMPLGTPLQTQNPWTGRMRMPQPTLSADGDTLYVLTNSGALLALSLSRRSLEWAVTYDAPADMGRFSRWVAANNTGTGMQAAQTGSSILRAGDQLWVKEAGGNRLMVIDPAVPAVKLRRSVSSGDAIVGLDGKQVYLLGNCLSALDRATLDLRWSSNPLVGADDLRLVFGDKAALLFGGRGIYKVSTENGDASPPFRGVDSGATGGVLYTDGKTLIAVSNQRIVAYPMGEK